MPVLGKIVVFFTIASASVLATAAEIKVEGEIFYPAEQTKAPSFFYERRTTQTGDETNVVVRYFDKQKQPIIEEEYRLKKNEVLYYEINQLQIKEKGIIEAKDHKLHFAYTRESGTQTDNEKREPDQILPDMAGDFLQAHWDELMKGDSVYCRLLLVEKLDSYGFKFFKSQEIDWKRQPAIEVKMKASSFVIAAFAPAIYLTLAKAPPHKVLEMNGRLPIRIPEVPNPKERSDYHAIDARMELH